MSARFWQAIDTAAHKLKLPKPIRRRICDRFDLSLGVTRDELRRTEGQRISDEINADPAEAERLRQARRDARAGNVTGRYDDA